MRYKPIYFAFVKRPKPEHIRKRQCLDKVRYPTLQKANAVALLYGHRVYPCDICDGYHCARKKETD